MNKAATGLSSENRRAPASQASAPSAPMTTSPSRHGKPAKRSAGGTSSGVAFGGEEADSPRALDAPAALVAPAPSEVLAPFARSRSAGFGWVALAIQRPTRTPPATSSDVTSKLMAAPR